MLKLAPSGHLEENEELKSIAILITICILKEPDGWVAHHSFDLQRQVMKMQKGFHSMVNQEKEKKGHDETVKLIPSINKQNDDEEPHFYDHYVDCNR